VIPRQPSLAYVKIDGKQQENVKYFQYLDSIITNDAKCKHVIKSRIAKGRAALNNNNNNNNNSNNNNNNNNNSSSNNNNSSSSSNNNNNNSSSSNNNNNNKNRFSSKLGLILRNKLGKYYIRSMIENWTLRKLDQKY